jgi:hypothetical protein
MKSGNGTSLATLAAHPGAGKPYTTLEEPTSVNGASPAEDKGKSSHRPWTPAKANSASSDREWLIDESTKTFYLSLFTSSKTKVTPPKTAQSRVARRGKTAYWHGCPPKQGSTNRARRQARRCTRVAGLRFNRLDPPLLLRALRGRQQDRWFKARPQVT